MNFHEQIHNNIVAGCDKVTDWFEQKTKGLKFPVYTSYDVRDSGWKIAPVDANIFPAGFNNICQVDKDAAQDVFTKYLNEMYGQVPKNVALLTEEHTGNLYYWDNVYTIKTLLESAGSAVYACIPRTMKEPILMKSAAGHEVTVSEAQNRGGEVFVNNTPMDLVVSNNDFSESYSEWIKGLRTPMNPPHDLGWFRRKKSSYFQQYNQLAKEFAELIKLPAHALQIDTEVFEPFDVNDEDSREQLAARVEKFLHKLKEKYKRLGISAEPFCFIKNNAGTYGMAVMQVHSPKEIIEWSGRDKKKMKAAKGGREVSEIIIQEGIPTQHKTEDGAFAEPCIYLVGDQLVGGFLRAHSEKGADENLNSPGAVYKKLCMADLQHDIQDCPMENVYGWISKLAVLAVAYEAKTGSVRWN